MHQNIPALFSPLIQMNQLKWALLIHDMFIVKVATVMVAKY